jgi:glycosyltransferase involved in cell wall biosynthesis
MGADQPVTVPSPESSAFPDVSVVMPVHDMPLALVRKAIRSVRRQDHPGPIELVLWDDGSRDPVLQTAYAAIAGSFADAVAPVGERVIATFRTAECRGIARSRNDAVRRARAEWLIWLDGDDELPPDAIGRLLAAVRTSGSPYAIGQCRVLYEGGASQVHRNARYLAAWRRHRGSEADPLAQVVFNIHGGLVHRDLFWAIGGFDPWFSHAELVDWFRRLLRALPHPDAFDILDAVTYVCRKRRGSHSSDRARVEPQRVAALQRYALAEGVPPADLDAPMINVETGCPESKRVESAPASAGVEFLDRVPACP